MAHTVTRRYPCGCTILAKGPEITWRPCPVHAAASELLSALRGVMGSHPCSGCREPRALLAAIDTKRGR